MVTSLGSPDLLPDLARCHATAIPDGAAIVDGPNVWTWRMLDERASAIATAVADAGGRPGERVGLAVGTSALGIAALHGAPRCGVTAVLVHPRLSGPEVATLLDATACRVLVVDPAVDVVAPAHVATIRLDAIDPGATVSTPSRGGVATPEFIVPTSGTTARPRLARLPLDRIAASAHAWTVFLPPASGWLLSLGLAHVAGIGIVARAAAAGVPVVVPAGRHPDDLLRAIAAARRVGVVVSHASLVATQLAALLDVTADAPPPAGLRAVILGGGPIPEPLIRRAIEAGWPVVPSYGLTETASGVVALPSADVAMHTTSAGRPLPGVEVRIDDGRIAVRGPMVFAGYLDDQPATAAALATDHWLTTGDLGRLDADGRLTVLGRVDDIIISGGEKVAPAEVEAVLLNHPAVTEVAVTGIPDPTWGSVPVALIVTRPGMAPTDDDLSDHALGRLARFKVPARFIRVTALPRDDLGKVNRAWLARQAADRHPEPTCRSITLDDGQNITLRDLAPVADRPDAPVIVLLHATLSTSGQLLGLASRLAQRARVLSVDRRGSGESPMAHPAPVSVERHATDVIELLQRLGVERALLVGHSFGGVVALRATVLAPERITGFLVWEPPYLVMADPPVRARMAAMAIEVERAFAEDGPTATARLFLEAVAGDGAWKRLRPRQRHAIGREGPGVLADVSMRSLTADGLDSIACPAVVATGGSSEPFYRPIADALAARIGPSARRVDLPGLSHLAPIVNPDVIAGLVLDLLDRDR